MADQEPVTDSVTQADEGLRAKYILEDAGYDAHGLAVETSGEEVFEFSVTLEVSEKQDVQQAIQILEAAGFDVRHSSVNFTGGVFDFSASLVAFDE